MMHLLRFLTAYIFLTYSAVVFAEQQDWLFVWVSSGPSTYYVKQGTAKVIIENGQLKAQMTSTDGVEYKIVGSIAGQRVNAKFTVLDSDYFISSPFSGSYKKQLWSGFADTKGRESISLTDGWNFIGLKREIKP